MRELSAPAAVMVVPDKPVRRSALRWLAFLFFGLALLFAAIAASAGDMFFFRLGTEALIYGGLALSVDMLLGKTGLLPLGQALFFGFGAYVSALVLKNVAPSFWLAMLAVLVCTTVVGFIGGVIAIRAKGVYFALISLALHRLSPKWSSIHGNWGPLMALSVCQCQRSLSDLSLSMLPVQARFFSLFCW